VCSPDANGSIETVATDGTEAEATEEAAALLILPELLPVAHDLILSNLLAVAASLCPLGTLFLGPKPLLAEGLETIGLALAHELFITLMHNPVAHLHDLKLKAWEIGIVTALNGSDLILVAVDLIHNPHHCLLEVREIHERFGSDIEICGAELRSGKVKGADNR